MDTRRQCATRKKPIWALTVITVIVVLLLTGGCGIDQPDIEATETRKVADFATCSRETAIAQDAVATALADYIQEGLNQTATAQAAAITVEAERLNTTATAQAMAQVTAVVAQAATATAQANEIRCRDIANIGLYTLTVTGPDLHPGRGITYVVGGAAPAVYAVWHVANTGECVWTEIALSTVEGKEVENRVEGLPDADHPIPPGETADIKVYFGPETASVDVDWILRINGFPLPDLPHLELQVTNWVVPVTPTPSPTPTYTPTPILPTDTPTPSPQPTSPPAETRPPAPTATPGR